jgi:hypothetical protein
VTTTPRDIARKNGEAAVDRAVARGKIADSAAEPWRRMARNGGNPEPALAVLPDDPGRGASNMIAASAQHAGTTTGMAAPSPELLTALGFPVAPAGSVAGAGPEFS